MIVNLADLADSMNKQNLYHQQDHWPPAKKITLRMGSKHKGVKTCHSTWTVQTNACFLYARKKLGL